MDFHILYIFNIQDNAKLREYVFEILKVLSNLPEPVVEFVSEQIAYGMDSLLENENSFNFFKYVSIITKITTMIVL